MNRNYTRIAAAIFTGSLLIATPAAAGAPTSQRWEICPAIDTEPLCEIERPPTEPGADGNTPTLRQPNAAPNEDRDDPRCSARPWSRIVPCAV